MLNPLLGRGEVPHVKEHHLAQHGGQVGAGVGIVADESDALWRQALVADRQQLIAHCFGNPRINAVRNDVVEWSPRRVDRQNILLNQSAVLEPEMRDQLLPLLNRRAREVHSRELAFRQSPGHGDQVLGMAAAQFQHATVRDRCGRHAE